MNFGFTCTGTLPGITPVEKLPEMIAAHSNYEYTRKGNVLQPVVHLFACRWNSFVPEITVEVTEKGMLMTGRPILFVRIFMAIWFAALIVMQGAFLVSLTQVHWNYILPAFIPTAMCLFGYGLFKIATALTFHRVLRAMK